MLLDDMIAATIATENLKLYALEIEIASLKSQIAIDVIKRIQKDPQRDINTINVEMFDKYKEKYSAFLNQAGTELQLPEWIEQLRERHAREQVKKITLDIADKAKAGADLPSIREMIFKAEDALEKRNLLEYDKMKDVAKRVVNDAMDIWETPNSLTLPLVGDIITTLYGGEMIVVAGRPGMGKTTFMLELAYQMALNSTKVGFVSLEMTSEQLVQRMCQRFVDINLRNYLPKLNEYPEQKKKFFDGMDYLSTLPLLFDDNASRSLGGLLMTLEKMIKLDGIKIVIIDYMQLVTPPSKGSRNDEVAAISRALKLLALRNKITVIVASQLNRAVERQENKRPHLADLRDSGAIEQDADVVAFLYREGYYNKDVDPETVEVIVAKQRSGITGTKELRFDLRKQKFEEVE